MTLSSYARDESGIVVAWLVRIVIGLALTGVVMFDAGSIVVNFFTLDGVADEVALQVSSDLATGTDPVPNLECQRRSRVPACVAVYEAARAADVRVVSASFDQEGVFHLELKRKAKTLLVSRIGAIEDWGVATASTQADTN